MPIAEPLAIDRTIRLDVNGSSQRVRVCAARAGLPPLLIVQAGPGLPLLHEAPKFQRLLNLEKDFLVGYWDQRGCGDVPQRDAMGVSLPQQVEDLRTVLRWFQGETKQRAVLFGISLGATVVLRTVEHAVEHAKAVIAVSPDLHTARSDDAAFAFLQAEGRRADSPPYLDSAALQRRARLLANLGTIEWKKTFGALFQEMLVAMIGTYGIVGTVRALRNMNLIQRNLLPELNALDLFANPPRVTLPVHCIFGELDALNPASIVDELPAAVAAPACSVIRVPDAGHMVHFDHPAIVRSIVERV